MLYNCAVNFRLLGLRLNKHSMTNLLFLQSFFSPPPAFAVFKVNELFQFKHQIVSLWITFRGARVYLIMLGEFLRGLASTPFRMNTF